MRLVMEISNAHRSKAGGTACGGLMARIVGGRKAREPGRQNGQHFELLSRNGGKRKSGRHCHFWAVRPKALPEGPFELAIAAGTGPGRSGAAAQRRSRMGVFVG